MDYPGDLDERGNLHDETSEVARLRAEIVALRAENERLVERRANDDRVICGLYARVAELVAENEHMRGIFLDLSDWLNKGAIIKATDPALPVVIGPELTTNLHIQGPLAGKEGE